MKKDYGKKILKNEKEEFTNLEYFLARASFILSVLLLSVTLLIIYYLTSSALTSFDYIKSFVYLILTSISSFCLMLVFFMFIVKYLIIYENGILIRRENFFTFLKRKFIPFDQIRGVEITEDERYCRDVLMIYTNSQKPYKLLSNVVSNYKEAKKVILNHIKG